MILYLACLNPKRFGRHSKRFCCLPLDNKNGQMSLTRISQALGLSVTTVSRALGGYSDVSTATRSRVEAEAARIGYRPHAGARKLRLGRADAVGLILPTGAGRFDDPFFLRLISGVGPALAEAGLDLLVSAAPPGDSEMRAYRHMVEGRRVDGFLLARMRERDRRLAFLQAMDVPFVAHGRSDASRPYAFVDTDGTKAVAAATRRLISFGHREIAFIGAAGGLNFSTTREAGWRLALSEAGLAASLVRHQNATENGGFIATHDLLQSAAAVTAIVCATDRIAVGVLHALTETALRAGRDIAVIGFDDHAFSAHTDPPLTTIAQPVEEAGRRMVGMLVALFGGADPEGLSEIMPTTLIPRGSDARPDSLNAAEHSRNAITWGNQG